MANALPPIPIKTSIADDNGFVSQVWVSWFIELFNRVGGSSGASTTQLLTLITNLQTQTGNLEGGLSKGRDL